MDLHGKAVTAGSRRRGGDALAPRGRLLFLTAALVATFALLSFGVQAAGAFTGALGPLSEASFTVLAPAVSQAEAPSYQRPFEEAFGSAEQPTLGSSEAIAVDPSTGDLLVASGSPGTISRFHPDGTPAPFAALGTNVIDGKEANAKPCGEEPASCDKTPQNGLVFTNTPRSQMAVDPLNGDIYVTQGNSFTKPQTNAVDIFSSTGSYLGQLTASSAGNFEKPCGVAVDANGAVYVAGEFGALNGVGARRTGIAKYVPTSGVPVNADNVAMFVSVLEQSSKDPCLLAAGTGSSAGFIFASEEPDNQQVRETLKINEETGASSVFAEGLGAVIGVDPTTGNLLIEAGGPEGRAGNDEELEEFDGADEAITEQEAQSPLSRLFSTEAMGDFALGNSGEVYAAYRQSGFASVYGTPVLVPTPVANAAGNVIGTKATLSGTVDPSGLEVTACVFEWGSSKSYGHTAPCEDSFPEGKLPIDSKVHPVHLNVSGLIANGATYHFRIAATDEHGTEYSPDESFVTAHTVVTEPASEVEIASATLNGTLRPEGLEYSSCLFEYGVVTGAKYEHTAPCEPAAPSIEGDYSPHAVSAKITGLQAGVTYRFRIQATTSQGALAGEEQHFQTSGPPQIREVHALDATQTEATLEARIDPSGYETSYRFEWGSTTGYEHRVPADFEPSLGSGTTPVRVTAQITGLSAGTVYHYRVVASNTAASRSITVTPDEYLETLDSCGFPDGRCVEMLSPKELGQVAAPGRVEYGANEVLYQASSASGGLAYRIEGGLPEATADAEVLYLASRGTDGWSSSQLTPPITSRNEQRGIKAQPSAFLGFSPDLGCGVVASAQPLTDDPASRPVAEAGGANLYLRGSDGSYTLLTDTPPSPLVIQATGVAQEFKLIGLSSDCRDVVFSTTYNYADVPGVGDLYEWTASTGLKRVGWVPGNAGEEAVEAEGGVSSDQYHAVSEDGSKVFFSATRVVPGNPSDAGETGKRGLFVREGGTVTRDVSASHTSTPDTGATYQGATPDGSRVYFTANAGLTSSSSAEGTDLYEYDLKSEALTDLSASDEVGGAEVAGLVGVGDEGSQVYFVALGRLVPGQGGTLVQNRNAGTESLYDEAGGTVRFVGAVDTSDDVATNTSKQRTSRVSPNGRYLLFESSAQVTGYDNDGAPQAYLYDAQAQGEATVCVSCRQDGGPTSSPLAPLSGADGGSDALYEPQSLVIREGQPEVFFESRDDLAAGAGSGASQGGEWNIYEWAHDQVFDMASEPSTHGNPTFIHVEFEGASSDGLDLYFTDPGRLNWENPEGRYAVWDARVGGGFPEPPMPAAGCEPAVEGSCQGGASQAPASSATGTAIFSGPGNTHSSSTKKTTGSGRHKSQHKTRKHVKRRGKQRKKSKAKSPAKRKRGNAGARKTNGNGRAGK
jgi:hypothetical protein